MGQNWANSKETDVVWDMGTKASWRKFEEADLWRSTDLGVTKTKVSLARMSGLMQHGCMAVVDKDTLFVAGGFQHSEKRE